MKKNFKAVAILVAMLVCAASFTGCGEEIEDYTSAVSDTTGSAESADVYNSNINDPESPESETTDGGDESSDPDAGYDESLHDLSSEESSTDESIDESQNIENASKAQTPSESSKTSGNDEFDEVFKDNKLDMDCEAAYMDADTTESMITTKIKYKDLWIKEAENANSQLQGSSLSDEEKQSIQSDYDEWVAGLDAKQQEIIDEEMKISDGSIYRVNAAEKFMNYCRDYAIELYKKMYETDGTFEMAFK